ncbi:MAG: DUF2782 domain-containing protein [Xanthomonadales bacterium]|nr:DUF2782 domain-containing protein [Xanthomonadales bacterium]
MNLQRLASVKRPSKYTAKNAVVLALLCLTLPLGIQAQSQPADNELEIPPAIPAEGAAEQPLPPKVQDEDEQLEPTVTIRDEEGRRIEEYSRAGQVYMVKVIPDKGVPYYYIDTDGDGRLETAPTKGLEPVRPVYWKVKEWD